MATTSQHPVSPPQRDWRQQSIRIAVTVFLLLSLAFVLYSIAVPIWAYGLLFSERPDKVNLFWYGLGVPFRDFPVRSLFVLALLILALTVSRIRRQASRFLARRFTIVFIASAVVVIITAIVVRWRLKASYEEAVNLRTDAAFHRSAGKKFLQFTELGLRGKVPEVAYFVYQDEAQINSLYSQIEPDWIEKQRTETNTSGEQAKVGTSSGPANAELGASRGRERQSVQQPPPDTPQRKCLKFMQYELERGHTIAYTTGFEWIFMNFSTVTFKVAVKPAPETTELPLNQTEIAALQRDIKIGYFDNSQRVHQE